MSSEMVACIAVESLSILEKMHLRGYVIVLVFVVFKVGLSTFAYRILMMLNFPLISKVSS